MVGVIASLALFFLVHIARPVAGGPIDWAALVIAAAAAAALLRYKVGVIPVIAACALAGLVLSWAA